MAKKRNRSSPDRSKRVRVLRGAYRGSIGTLVSTQQLAGRTVHGVKFEPDGITHRYEGSELERLVASH